MLAGAVIYYGATSEVAWLFLLGYWIFALLAVSLAYAVWNGDVSGRVGVVGTESGDGSPVEDLPEWILAGMPIFEGDRMRVSIELVSRHGTRGPARVSGWIGGTELSAAAGRVSKQGWSELRVLGPLRRGPVAARDWAMERGDPLGFINHRNKGKDFELTLVLPRFKSLAKRPNVRELEASIAAPRAGSGTEMFGVREYRPGDPLRRIHWRSSARHGELIVREFEPPGLQTLGIFCDPSPPTADAADQIARLAASEAWDCLRAGGRVVLWAPGAEASLPGDSRSLWALLEWLARYPNKANGLEGLAPRVGDAIAVMASASPEIDEALATIQHRGGRVRAWVVGQPEIDLDVPVQRAGLVWPLP